MTTKIDTTSNSNKSRLLYVDNLRFLLTILVILIHLSIGYGAPGDWYYNEDGQIGTVSSILMTLFVALNQAFFMGFFFMLSSFFISGSLDRKGARLFLMDRLKRLGIPMLFYALVLNPLLEYALAVFHGFEGSFFAFSAAFCEEIYGFAGAIPVGVAIHCVVAADDCGDVGAVFEFEFFDFVLEESNEFARRAFGNVAAVCDCVDVDVFEAFFLCEFEEGE